MDGGESPHSAKAAAAESAAGGRKEEDIDPPKKHAHAEGAAGEKPGSDYEPWIEKYRPQKLKDVVGQEAIVRRLESYAKSREMPHLLLVGRAGIGKSSCVLALAHELYGADIGQCFLELNASDERGIDVVRGKIKDFARTLSLATVPFKVIFLDEADALTPEAQQALRRTMERYSDKTRFILAANYSSRIIEPIQSRCAVFRFAPLSEAEIGKIVDNIASGEKLKIDEKARQAVIYVSEGDARKAANVLQGAASFSEKVSEEDVFKIASRARPKEIVEMVQLAVDGRFPEARKLLDELLVKYGLSGEEILLQAYREVTSLDVPDKAKVWLVDKIGEYDFRISQGANERLQLEAMLAQMATAKQATA
jgi:replication factor C small subunit